MSITEKINNIRKAVLGRDVRENIASAIEECYTDASSKDNANMEVKQARGTYNVLGDRLNNTDNNISNLKSTKADKKDLEETNKNISINSARIDTFTSLPSGSTAGNAELIDIRVMANGKTANTAGEAVRAQTKILNDNINDYTCISEVKFDWVYGKGTKLNYDIGSTVTFANITNPSWKTAIVDCKEGDIYSTTNTIIGNELNALGFVDSANKLIKASDKSFWVANSSIRYFEVPKNAVKFIVNTISSDDDCRYFKGEKLLYNKNIPCYRIVGAATFISKGKSGVTGNNQIFYHRGRKSFAISKNYDSNVKFDYDYLPTIKGATFILGDKTLNYHDGKISCNEDVINISGFGSVSGKNTGVTEAGQFYININDGKLKLVTYYNSSNSDIEDLTIEFDTNSLYVYKNKFYKYTGKGNFYGLSQIEINIGSNIDWTETNKNIALGNISIGDTVSFEPEKINNYRYVIVECNPHDLFLLKVSGGVTPRAWAFADKNKKLLKRAKSGESLENCIIEAPVNACYLIVNNNDNLCKVPQISNASLSDIYNASMYSSKNREKEIAKIAEDDICSFIKGISFADELNNHLIDFTKPGDLMVHVSTICIINDIIYCTYYANTKSAKEKPEEHTARFAYCPLSNTTNITFVDLQTIGDTFDSKTVTKIYDTIMIKKDDDTLYLMWTASLGDDNYYRLYRTYTISTGTLSEVMCNNFKVNEDTDVWNVNNMISLIDNNNIAHRNINGDIGLMQKVTEHMENEEKYYYTGAYVGSFNCIVKSKDLITWEYVSAPNFINEAQWENATYVIGDKVYYFVRQYSNNSTGFLTRYDLNEKTWESPVFINDCQSRSDFFEYNNELYLVHAPKDRNHISIMKIDKNNLNKSTEIQTAKVSDYFYPFTCVYNNELYMSFTQSRKHIYVSKFTINSMSADSIINKFKKLFFE